MCVRMLCVCLEHREKASGDRPSEWRKQKRNENSNNKKTASPTPIRAKAIRWHCIAVEMYFSLHQGIDRPMRNDKLRRGRLRRFAVDAPIANYRSSSSASSFRFYCFHSNFICFVHSFAFAFAQYYSLQLIYSSVTAENGRG